MKRQEARDLVENDPANAEIDRAELDRLVTRKVDKWWGEQSPEQSHSDLPSRCTKAVMLVLPLYRRRRGREGHLAQALHARAPPAPEASPGMRAAGVKPLTEVSITTALPRYE